MVPTTHFIKEASCVLNAHKGKDILLAHQADSDTPKALVCIHLCLLSSKMWEGERKERDFVFWVGVKAGLCSVRTGRSSLPQPPGPWAGQTKRYWHRPSPRPGRKSKTHIMATTLLPVVAKRGRKVTMCPMVRATPCCPHQGPSFLPSCPAWCHPGQTTCPHGGLLLLHLFFGLSSLYKAARVAAPSWATVPGLSLHRPSWLLPQAGTSEPCSWGNFV